MPSVTADAQALGRLRTAHRPTSPSSRKHPRQSLRRPARPSRHRQAHSGTLFQPVASWAEATPENVIDELVCVRARVYSCRKAAKSTSGSALPARTAYPGSPGELCAQLPLLVFPVSAGQAQPPPYPVARSASAHSERARQLACSVRERFCDLPCRARQLLRRGHAMPDCEVSAA